MVLGLLLSANAYAAKFSAKVGDIVENEVSFGKRDKFPLPPGKFTVTVIKKSKEFRDVMLVQIDEDTGLLRWSIKIMATGSTQWESWNPGKMRNRTNVYFIKKKLANKKYECRIIIN